MLQIITDSASDITKEQAKKMGIYIIPLRVHFQDGDCPQEKDEDFQVFYDRLTRAESLPITSQPSPAQYVTLFERFKKADDEVLVITLSGGLSGTITAAKTAREICGYEDIYIVDSRQAIISQRLLVEHAVKLRNQNFETDHIVREIKKLRDRITVCGVVDTLTYLQKGGRIPSSLAFVGNMLNIKPVIVLENKILKTIGKVRGRKAGIKCLYDRFENGNPDLGFPVYFGYTSNRGLVEQFMAETIEKYHIKKTGIYPVGGVIGTHVGTDCIAIAFVLKEKRI